MIQIKANKTTKTMLVDKITSFYINIWYDRLINLTKRKYSYEQARKNIISALQFFCMTFDDSEVKKTQFLKWKNKEWFEIKYKNWHFAVIVQLDMFGNNVAIVQDCIHDKDYHNDTMQTEPFKMDNDEDQAHLVDWKLNYLNKLISESIRDSIERLLGTIHNFV